MPNQEFLNVQGVSLAYNRHLSKRATGAPQVGLMFLGGFASDKEGSKALALEELAMERDIDFLRFDYLAHGQSGGDFEAEGCISRWLSDTLAMIDQLTRGPQIVVGSSMGGWLALLAAKHRPVRLKAVVGIAAAPDFATELTPTKLGPEALAEIEKNGVHYEPTPYGPDPYIWTKLLLDDAKTQRVLDGSLALPCPLHLIQGQEDPDVPWSHALKILETVKAPRTDLTLIADGDHRLSREEDLALLREVVKAQI